MNLRPSAPWLKLALLLALLLSGGCAGKPAKNDKVTQANEAKIKNGMTQAEVEAILGPTVPLTAADEIPEWKAQGMTMKKWESEPGETGNSLVIGFDKAGKVQAKSGAFHSK
jgi:hypothetical protein